MVGVVVAGHRQRYSFSEVVAGDGKGGEADFAFIIQLGIFQELQPQISSVNCFVRTSRKPYSNFRR